MKTYNVGIIGCTGMVGQRFATLLADHPWFVGVQYHPEYKSTVSNPHPLFVAFVKAAIDYCEANGGHPAAKR